jgi:hypothetical protein
MTYYFAVGGFDEFDVRPIIFNLHDQLGTTAWATA